MAMSSYDFCLLVSALIFLVLDIVLALCIRLVLPPYITQGVVGGWYPANGHPLPFEEAVNICPCLRQVFPRGTKTAIKFEKIPAKAWSKRSVDPDQLWQLTEKYPFLVSLSSPYYLYDNEEQMFVCNGLVQSDEWLLTTKNCIQEEPEWYNLTVRSGSVFWSKLGQAHAVVDIANTTDDNLVLLKVQPKFSENVVPFPPMKYAYGGNWTYAVSLGWNDHTCGRKLDTRYKHKLFDVEEWTSKNISPQAARICSKIVEFCRRVSSKFLLTSCHQLIGLQMTGSKNCNAFLRVGNKFSKDRDDTCSSIYKDLHTSNDAEVCQSY